MTGAKNKAPEKQYPPVLIIGYKRTANIEQIIDFCDFLNIPRIFLYLDGIHSGDAIATASRRTLLERLEARKDGKTEIVLRASPENRGCAVSVLEAVTWALESSESIAVLEDDCLPTKSFFDFVSDAEEIFKRSSDLWIICGTQFAPISRTMEKSFRSPYALTWGWFTTREKWTEIKDCIGNIFRSALLDSFFSISPSTCFWSAGARRALLGYTDVWDTILLYCMHKKLKASLLPGSTFVRNIGNDEFALHTSQDNTWTNQTTGTYSGPASFEANKNATLWLKQNFYKIRARHIITTKMGILLDVFRKKKFFLTLNKRLTTSRSS